MAKTKHWDDTSCYALKRVHDHHVVYSIAGVGPIALDHRDDQAEEAIAELLDAGCPVVTTEAELIDLARAARGRPRWELVGLSDIGLWRDQWGTIWLRAQGNDPVLGAVHLSKYEALGLAEQLIALANSAPG